MNFRRITNWMKSVPARIQGSLVIPNIEMGTSLSTRAKFTPDQNLEQRLAEARSKLPENSVKSLMVGDTDELPIG